MFGKLLGKGGASDMAEKLAGVDLDGDGDIGGVPVQKNSNNAPAKPAVAAPAPAAAPAATRTGGAPAPSAVGMLSGLLSKSGKTVNFNSVGSPASLLQEFRKFSPDVQKKADAQARNFEDGANMQVSTLTGKKKSLLIGINYFGTAAALRGCINDVQNVRKLITEKFNFPTDPSSMLVLTDDQTDAQRRPTKANIIAGFKWLVAGAKSGDSLFLHFSGHGATQKDVRPDTDEADGQDETIVPLDYETAGMIVDDEIFDLLVAALPKGVRLTALMDCCHSGSVFDLPYSYVLDGSRDIPVEIDNRKVLIASALAAGKALLAKDGKGVVSNLMQAGQAFFAMQGQQQGGQAAGGGGGGGLLGSLGGLAGAAGGAGGGGGGQSQAQAPNFAPDEPNFAPDPTPVAAPNFAPDEPNFAPDPTPSFAPDPTPVAAPAKPALGTVSTSQNVTSAYIQVKTALADVIQFSGCRDEQTSADAVIGGEATGAMSWALIKAVNEFGTDQSYAELLRNIRANLKAKYKQIPQMSAGHRLVDMDGKFHM